MEKNSLVNLTGNITQDVLSCLGIPTATIGSLVNDYLKKKNLAGIQTLLGEMRENGFDDKKINQNEFISILFQYQFSVIQGVAKNNLRLMARLICGLNEKNELTATSFQKYAKILADLESDEVIFISKLAKYKEEAYAVDSLLVELIGKRTQPPSSKLSDYLIILNSLTRTGFIGLQGGGMWADEKSEYNTNFYVTEKFKKFVNYFNWSDVAFWSRDNKK